MSENIEIIFKNSLEIISFREHYIVTKNIQVHFAFLAKTLGFIPCICWKLVDSIWSEYAVYCSKRTVLFPVLPTRPYLTWRCNWNCKVSLSVFAEYACYDPKFAVKKTMLSFTLHLQWQRTVMLLAFWKTGSDQNCRISGQIRKRFLNMLDILYRLSISDLMMREKKS